MRHPFDSSPKGVSPRTIPFAAADKMEITRE
jgi:hypothetical protein